MGPLPGFIRTLTQGMAAEAAVEPDADLVRRFLDTRDATAFEALVRRHGPMVYRVCRRTAGQEQDAEDAFQATFLVLARNLRALRRHASLASWLHGTARRVALKAKASAAARKKRELIAPELAPPADPSWHEVRAVLDEELVRLPERWRLPLVLCHLSGRTLDEAAVELGWTKSTLRRRLDEARDALANRLVRRGVWPAVLSAALLSDSLAPAALPPALVTPILQTVTAAPAVTARVLSLSQGARPAMTKTLILTATAFAALAVGWVATGSADPPVNQLAPPAAADPPARAASPQWVAGMTATHSGRITAVALVPGAVVAGDDQGMLIAWDAATGKKKETLSYGTDGGGQVSVDGLQVSADGTHLYKLLNRGGAMHQFSVRKEGRDSSGFAESGRQVYYGVTGGGRHWLGRNAGGNELVLSRNDLAKGKFEEVVDARFPHADKVTHAAGDGNVIVSVSGTGKAVLRGWDSRREKPVWEADLGDTEVTAVLVAPGGKRVAVAGDAGQLRVFDATTGKAISKAEKLTGIVRAAAFDPDGARLVAGCRDGSARVFDAETGKDLAVLKGHTDAVTAVAFGPAGVIATGSADKTARVWTLGADRGAPKEEEVKFETVIKRDGGGPKQAAEVVVRTQKEWAAFAETFWLAGFRDEMLKIKFDFDTEVVVAVVRGGSESVATQEDGVNKIRRTGDTAVVEWTVVESDQRESEKSYPFHVIRMPKVKEIKFKKSEKTIGG